LNAASAIKIARQVQEDDVIATTIYDQLRQLEYEKQNIVGELDALDITAIADGITKAMGEKTKAEKAKQSVDESGFSIAAFNNALGIRWTTPLAVYEGWVKYWETRKEAKKERIRRDASLNAQDMGAFFKQFSPFRDFENEVEQTLNAAVEGDNNKAKKA